MVLFHVKATEKVDHCLSFYFSELTESTAMVFSMVCELLQALYTTAEKQFRINVFLIFDVPC